MLFNEKAKDNREIVSSDNWRCHVHPQIAQIKWTLKIGVERLHYGLYLHAGIKNIYIKYTLKSPQYS